MAVQSNSATGLHTDVRSDFSTKEGTYRNVKASEHCRPSRQPLFGKELSPVQVSCVSCKGKEGLCEWIVFNSGRELYFYPFQGVGKVPDLKRPLDKRVYKAPTIPVCHDFNVMTRSMEHLDLVVGFSTGPLQYLNPLDKIAVCAFNEDASIDNTRVTTVRWVPGSEHSFVSSHRSGNLYVWTTEHHASSKVITPINYVQQAETMDARIFAVRQRNKCPLVCRWEVEHGPINAFAFSPDSVHIAIASQDGFLRIYDFHKQTIYGRMRSYFGGLLCVCWSPDGKYAVTGGEDDLVTVWSFEHRKVVARGEGHRSYVNAVAFDPHMTVLPNLEELKGAEKAAAAAAGEGTLIRTQAESSSVGGDLKAESRSTLEAGRYLPDKASTLGGYTAYRLGSVGQDTQICLWDLSGDSLKVRRLLARGRSRKSRPVSMADLGATDVEVATKEPLEECSVHDIILNGGETTEGREPGLIPNHFGSDTNLETSTNHLHITNPNPAMSLPVDLLRKEASPSVSVSSTSSVSSKKGKKRKKDKYKIKKEKVLKPHRRGPMHKVIKLVGSGFTGPHPSTNHTRRPVGTFESCNSDDIAPKMHEVNTVEPLVAKKIGVERLTCLVFREDCILVACHEGFISTWARPNVCMSWGEQEEEGANEVPHPPTVTGNPGINSPKPGAAMDHDAPIKSTAI